MILVFGATGMVGQAVMVEARRRGMRVGGAARAGADHAVDLATPDGATEFLGRLRPSLVINAAAISSIDGCERAPALAARVNAQAVAAMSRYCRAESVPLVQVSTDHFYAGDGVRKHGEEEPVLLLNHYARTKYAAEIYACEAPRALVLRTNVTGRRGWTGNPTFAEWAFESLRRRAPLVLFEDFHTSTIDTPAFARALFDLVERGARGIVNVGAATVTSKRRFVHQLARAIHVALDWDEPASVRSLAAPRADSLGLDVRKAERLLGYALPDTEMVCDALAAQWDEQRCGIPLAS